MLPFYSFIFVLLQNKIIFNTTKQNRSRFFWHNSSTQAEAVLDLWDMLFFLKKNGFSRVENKVISSGEETHTVIHSLIDRISHSNGGEQDLMERIINQTRIYMERRNLWLRAKQPNMCHPLHEFFLLNTSFFFAPVETLV